MLLNIQKKHINQGIKVENLRQHKEYDTSAMGFRYAIKCNDQRVFIYPGAGAYLYLSHVQLKVHVVLSNVWLFFTRQTCRSCAPLQNSLSVSLFIVHTGNVL